MEVRNQSENQNNKLANEFKTNLFVKFGQICFFNEQGMTFNDAYVNRIKAHFLLITLNALLYQQDLTNLKIINQNYQSIFDLQASVQSDDNDLWRLRLEPINQNQVLKLYHSWYEHLSQLEGVLETRRWNYFNFVCDLVLLEQPLIYWKFNQALEHLFFKTDNNDQ